VTATQEMHGSRAAHQATISTLSSRSIRVMVADVCTVMRVGLVATIEAEPGMHVVATAAHRHELSPQLHPKRVDVLVINAVGMGESPLSLLHQIMQTYPWLRLVIFSTTLDFIPELLAMGVKACVAYTEPEDQLRQAIRSAASGQCFLSPVMQDYVDRCVVQSTFYRLLPRELQIVRRIAQGLRNQEIADQLHLSLGTVDNHIRSIRKKTACSTRVELVRWYQRVYTGFGAPDAAHRLPPPAESQHTIAP
jgi:two-component system, NarL family, response regulator DesR